MPARKIKRKIQPVEGRKKGRKIKVAKDKFNEDGEKFEDEGNVEAAKKITSRKFKVAKPKSLIEQEGAGSIAEGEGETKIAPIPRKRKIKRKKK